MPPSPKLYAWVPDWTGSPKTSALVDTEVGSICFVFQHQIWTPVTSSLSRNRISSSVTLNFFNLYISDSGKAGSARRDPVDDPFPYHDNCCMGATGPGNSRHHRRIDHRQPLYSLDAAVLIDDRHWV